MKFEPESAFYRLLNTKYDSEREREAIEILDANPELATIVWPGPDERGQPFVKGATALHYAANDGKQELVGRLLEFGADVNASEACWFRSVLSWAANNARIDCIRQLLDAGASPTSLDAMHAAAWGGSGCGQGHETEYAETLRLLVESGADVDDRRIINTTRPWPWR